MEDNIMRILNMFKEVISRFFRLGDDAASEEEVIAGIENGITFRGAKLWILILAIFTASLGLNTNSAAVIIGAMLISPLMGPIIGMGLGAGIYDFDLLRRSWHNYIVATLFSVVTATLYFLLTPIAEAQSELLARTSPTIYDVLIALCGGLAGIVALSSRSQRMGNVIPGVAIATALMPPLCTVGFGIATANWTYAAGALYLFIINTIFIAMATFIGAVFIMKFKKRSFIDKQREKRVKHFISLLAVVTIIPSVILTYGMVRESYFERRVSSFIQTELHFPSTQVLSHSTDFRNRSFSVVLIGAEVDSVALENVRDRMSFYKLDGVEMRVLQGTAANAKAEELHELLKSTTVSRKNSEAIISQQQIQISELESRLGTYQSVESEAKSLCSELQVLCPQVSSVSIARGVKATAEADTVQVMAVIDITSPISTSESEKLTEWMSKRMRTSDIRVVYSLWHSK